MTCLARSPAATTPSRCALRLAVWLAAAWLAGCAAAPQAPEADRRPAQVPALAPPAEGGLPHLRRRLVLARIVLPGQPGAAAGQAPEDTEAQARLLQALALGDAFTLQRRPDIGPEDLEQAWPVLRESLRGADVLVVGAVEPLPPLPLPSTAPPAAPASFPAPAPAPSPRASLRLVLRALDPLSGATLLHIHARGEAATREQALSLAAAQAARSLAQRLEEQPWQARVLGVEGGRVRLSAGPEQGLRPGMDLEVQLPGDPVRSRRSGLLITLPGPSVARLRVDADGSARLVAGSLTGLDPQSLVVRQPSSPASHQPPRTSP